MHKPLIKTAIPFLLLVSLLASCTPAYRSGDNVPDLAIAPTAPIIAYDKGEISSALAASPWRSAQKVGECSSQDIPLWSSNQTLDNYRPNRALAIGYPYGCGGSWHSWNFSSEETAAEAALSGCLNYVKGRQEHTGYKCGARLVMVNEKLLVSKEELPVKSRVPFIMEVLSVTAKRFSIYGMFEYEGPGQNRALEVFSDRGEKVCTGEYSLSYFQAYFGSGNFTMNCFDGKLVGQGTLSVKKINLRHMSGSSTVGIGKGRTSDGEEFKFITGVTIDQYEKYEELLE